MVAKKKYLEAWTLHLRLFRDMRWLTKYLYQISWKKNKNINTDFTHHLIKLIVEHKCGS